MDNQSKIAYNLTGTTYSEPYMGVKYIFPDHLGSSNVQCADTGSLYNREEYYPFGETSFGSYGKKRYRFCGKERDEESGMYYYGARYYLPWTCRFVSVDPLAGKYSKQGSYCYAQNNPIMLRDHNGAGTGKGDKKTSKATGTGTSNDSSTSSFSLTYSPQQAQNLVYGGNQQIYDLRGPSGTTTTQSDSPNSYQQSAKTLAKVSAGHYKHSKAPKVKEAPSSMSSSSAFFGGMYDAAWDTAEGLKSLQTLEGWGKVGQGLYSMGKMAAMGPFSSETINIAAKGANFAKTASATDWAHATGYASFSVLTIATTGGSGEVAEATELGTATSKIETMEELVNVTTPKFAEGSFSVWDWTGYPSGGIKPSGPFRLLEGSEYQSARKLANETNLSLRNSNPKAYSGLQIHEIHPVKFGGSPTDLNNKIAIPQSSHIPYTNFWNNMMQNINKY